MTGYNFTRSRVEGVVCPPSVAVYVPLWESRGKDLQEEALQKMRSESLWFSMISRLPLIIGMVLGALGYYMVLSYES